MTTAFRDMLLRFIAFMAIGLCFIGALIIAQPLIIVLALAAIAFCIAPMLIPERPSLKKSALDA